MSTKVFQNLNEEKKQIILKAIEWEFLNKEFDHIKVTDICRRADIPRSAFYRYFDSLEDAIKSFLESQKDGFVKYISDVEKQSNGDRDQLYMDIFKAILDNEEIFKIGIKQMILAKKNSYFDVKKENDFAKEFPIGIKEEIIAHVGMSLIIEMMSENITKEDAISSFERYLKYLLERL